VADEQQPQPGGHPARPGVGEEYLTASQVATLLQVDDKTIYRWAKQDASLPVLKIGGVVRFPRERLLRWLREREQGQPRIKRQTLSPAKPASLQEAA
jgi:excisionase family DNA binding protein